MQMSTLSTTHCSAKLKKWDMKDFRRRNAEQNTQLRRLKREELLCKKRHIDRSEDVLSSPNASAESILRESLEKLRSFETIQDLPVDVLVSIRRILSSENSNCGLLEFVAGDRISMSKLAQCLTCFQRESIQLEAVWILTNVASGTSTQTYAVIEAGAIPLLVQILTLSSPSQGGREIQEQAIWCLSNITGDNAEFRDYVLDANFIPQITQFLRNDVKLSTLRQTAWCLSNCCRGKNPQPDFKKLNVVLPYLARLLYNKDHDVLHDVCLCLQHLSDADQPQIQMIIESGVTRRLIELLQSDNGSICLAALRAVGNISTGNDLQTQVLLNCNVLPLLKMLLAQHNESSIRRSACWTLSNITAGSHGQIQAVINCNIIPTVVESFKNGDFKIQKEAIWTIYNAVIGANVRQQSYLVDEECVQIFSEALALFDPKLVEIALDSLIVLLNSAVSTTANNSRSEPTIVEKGGVVNNLSTPAAAAAFKQSLLHQIQQTSAADGIEYLLYHPNEILSSKAGQIVRILSNSSSPPLPSSSLSHQSPPHSPSNGCLATRTGGDEVNDDSLSACLAASPGLVDQATYGHVETVSPSTSSSSGTVVSLPPAQPLQLEPSAPFAF